MFITDTKRIVKSGFLNFWRNGVISLSSILVLVIALFMIGSTLLLSAFFNAELVSLKDKVDINIYFLPEASQEESLNLKNTLEELPEVAFVEYISKEQVLENFRKRSEENNNQGALQALDELGENPFGPTLNIKAKQPDLYGSIANFLEGDGVLTENAPSYTNNYEKNKDSIGKLTSLIGAMERFGFTITIILIIIAILITVNTIRLAIYISKDEIAVMRLVGARNHYVRGPFIVEGILYGLVASLITVALFYPITLWIKNGTEGVFGGIDLFQYYITNFTQTFIILTVAGMTLGAVSSYFAVRKYLK